MEFDDTYRNKTPNKTRRGAGSKLEFAVAHETASPNSDNPHGTLRYNLLPEVQSSYHYLIARDGTVFRYLDPETYIAWHAGVRSTARGYTGSAVNSHSIGWEMDGPNDGTPITSAQRDSAISLLIYFRDTYGIPLERVYHLAHKEVAPGYKSDPRAYSIDVLLQLAAEYTPTSPERLKVLDVERLETNQTQWLASMARHAAHERGLTIAAQKYLYGLMQRLRVEPWFILGLIHNETNFGRTGAAAANNWLNIREYSSDRPHIVKQDRLFKRHSTVELGLEQGIIYLADAYAGIWGLKEVKEVLHKFAPPTDENNTDLYIKKVLEDRAFILSF